MRIHIGGRILLNHKSKLLVKALPVSCAAAAILILLHAENLMEEVEYFPEEIGDTGLVAVTFAVCRRIIRFMRSDIFSAAVTNSVIVAIFVTDCRNY